MRADPRGIAATIALGAAVASIAYTGFALTRVLAFGRRLGRPPAPRTRPTMTILKPVGGVEPGLEENLRSFCAQDYPAYDVVFGVLGADDPALPVIRRVAASFPDRTTVVVGDGVARFRNPKIANLAPMLAHARGEILAIADSDMRVTPGYLDALAEAFGDPRAGAVTAVYRGEPGDGTIASALGAMWISEQFAPSALVAATLEPLTYTFGATMAVRRTVLDEIGGLAALGDELADDHVLGRKVAAHGRRVTLAPYVVTNVVNERDLGTLLSHEIRWARTIRSVRPASYLGILLTYPVPLAWLHLALARDKRAARAIYALAAALRLAVHVTAHPLRGTNRPSARLILLRDALGVVVWTLGLFGRTVRWRDRSMRTR
jgi:ceramide glucosyltransferase